MSILFLVYKGFIVSFNKGGQIMKGRKYSGPDEFVMEFTQRLILCKYDQLVIGSQKGTKYGSLTFSRSLT